MVSVDTSAFDGAVPPTQQQNHHRASVIQGQVQTQIHAQQPPAAVPPPTAPPMNPSASFTFENFHLDPEDFQNFLLINPPLTEYSSHYYMNLSNNGNGNGNGNGAGAGVNNGGYATNAPIPDPLSASNTPIAPTAVAGKGLAAAVIPDSDQLLNELALKKQIPVSSVLPNEHLLNAPLSPQLAFQPFAGTDIARAGASSNTSSGITTEGTTTTANTTASGTALPNPAFTASNSQPIPPSQQQQQQQQQQPQSAQMFSNQYPFDIDVRLDEQQLPLPTRRLSISNGQIGQISMMVHSQLHPSSGSNSSGTPNSHESAPVPSGHGHSYSQSHGTASRLPQRQQSMTNVKNETIEVDTNGVPTRELLYNNEVIFNPNGPIPGTNAWKRAKILERNRIAASKCRAKKKNLQKKLQEDVDELNDENDRLRDMLVEMKRRVERYCERSHVDIAVVLASETQLKKEKEEEERLRKKKQKEARSTSEQVDLFLRENVL